MKETWSRIVSSPGESAIVAGFLVAVWVIFREYLHWDFDDSYIVYRIVDNILAGNGWVFNPGERYNASTSVLNTVLVSLVAFFVGDIPVSAHLVGAVGILVAVLVTYDLFTEEFGTAVGIGAALMVAGVLSANLTWGLETHLFAGLVLLFVWLEKRGVNTWYLLGLVFLTRPDGILFFGFKGLVEIYKTRRLPIKGPLQSLAVVLPWLVFSLAYFGQLMPATLANKVWQGQSGFWGRGNVYLDGLVSHLTTLGPWLWPVLVLAAVGVGALIVRRNTLLFLLVFVAIQQLFYVVLNVPAYHWYFASLDLGLLIAAMYGLAMLIGGERRLLGSRISEFGFVGVVLVFALGRLWTCIPSICAIPGIRHTSC